jgi:hypothetical protein
MEVMSNTESIWTMNVSKRQSTFFVSKDDDEQAGENISIDFDESKQMTFYVLKVDPNDKNGLSKASTGMHIIHRNLMVPMAEDTLQ